MACHPRAMYHIAGCCHFFTVAIPEPHATLQDAVTWRNQCHDRATLQGSRLPMDTIYRRPWICPRPLRLISGSGAVGSEVTGVTNGEHVWCQIDSLLIAVCYRSCNTNIVGRENEVELRKVITEVSNTDFVLMGDFSYPYIDWVHNSVKPGATVDTSGFLECLDDNFVTQHVVEPTRGTAVLDLVLTRDPDQISSVDVTETLGSNDHHMVSFVIHHRHESSKMSGQLEIT